MGVFAENQPIYASHNIPTFPTNGKRPASRGYQRVGIPGSAQLALDFPEIDALAFMAGERTKITVLDVDSPDEDLLRDMLKRHGQTPIIVQSGSGNFHAWYRNNGEKRKVRPDTSIPVDLLGGGVVVAPPSKGATGAYEFIRGSLADLHKLRPANNIIEFPRPKLVSKAHQQTGLITEGRNSALFNHLMRMARYCDDLEALLDEAFTFAEGFTDRTARHAFTDAEIRATAKSAWGYTLRGDNRYGAAPTANIPRETVLTHAARNPDAFALFSILQAHHMGLRAEFAISKGMAVSLGWDPRKFKAARAYLVEAGLLACVHSGGRGPRDPAKYRFC